MSEVVFDRVRKEYPGGGAPAVDDFSLVVRDGEFVVLVGPSGCGKSTTLRMTAGLETVTSGTISIGGRDVTSLAPKDRDIAMVFQNYALYPHMTVEENMSFALRLRKYPKDEIKRRVGASAESLGLAPYMKRLPRALSGGLRQRVALGRAIVREPAVFLFDEPLSNLDAKMRVEMRSEIIRLHNRLGSTMIYVTHDQTEAMTMGERIVVMEGGRIRQAAPPLEVYSRPADTFVAGFIGTPPMNLFPAGFIKDDAVVGVRPEHIALSPCGAAPLHDVAVEAVVDFTESLGSETLVHLRAERGAFAFVARAEGFSPLRHGEKTLASFDMAKASFFGLDGCRTGTFKTKTKHKE